MNRVQHVKLTYYAEKGKVTVVYSLTATPSFSPIDINVEFLAKDGWSASGDRLRFHIPHGKSPPPSNPMAAVIAATKPNLLIRRYDREEDCLAAIRIHLDGVIAILSNDPDFAKRYLRRVFLEMPPSFHSEDELEIKDEWVTEPFTVAMFAGLVAGALGWDSAHSIPPALEQSLEEARKALEIANYRSCVVMCRRGLEALLKFAFPRLLNRDPVDARGRELMLNMLIQEFRNANPEKIPAHMLHVGDALRVLGNVPGAHAADIENYRFSRFDAEFAIGSLGYFLDQYFSKIDTEVGRYYTLTIDLSDPSPEEG